MTDKHTPTPWAFKESNGRYISNEPFELDSDEFGTTSSAILGADGKVVCIVPEAHNGQWTEGERDRNISHIVKCVNNHARLVDMVADLADFIEVNVGDTTGTRLARALLAELDAEKE